MASPVIGGSHLNRMKVLNQKLKANGTESYLFTNLKKLKNQVNCSDEKSLVILDVPASYIEDLSFLNCRHVKVIGYEYSGSLLVDYNIIPFLSKFREFNAKKEIHSGLKYLIIRDEVINQKNISYETPNGILITLGAGKTKKNALDLRERILSQNKGVKVEIIVGKFSNQLTFLQSYIKKNPRNFAEHICKSKIVFTNGGATLVESIFLEKRIICWPQTQFEGEFAEYLTSIYDFDIINDIDNLPDLRMISSIPEINEKNEIDGKGAERVFRLVCDIMNH